MRSNSIQITVGEGVGGSLDLAVEIIQSAPGTQGESFIFEVNPAQLNFGQLESGQDKLQEAVISNGGTVNLSINASVSGDQIFRDNILLDNISWANYGDDLIPGSEKEVDVLLSIPSDSLASGVKSGSLTFWARAK